MLSSALANSFHLRQRYDETWNKSIFQELEELNQEVLREKKSPPIQTHFIDSTPISSPFMNSNKSSVGIEFVPGFNFLGKSGVKLIKGLRVAFISGVDFDILGGGIDLATQAQTNENYIGNYFTQTDITNVIDDYNLIVKNDPNKREGVDMLLTSQWPLGIDDQYMATLALPELKQLFYNSSSGVSALIDMIKPRYIYSSQLDIHHKRLPFNCGQHLSRFVALGSLPGKHKPEESKQVYIQAVELEPIFKMSLDELQKMDCEHTTSSYKDLP